MTTVIDVGIFAVCLLIAIAVTYAIGLVIITVVLAALEYLGIETGLPTEDEARQRFFHRHANCQGHLEVVKQYVSAGSVTWFGTIFALCTFLECTECGNSVQIQPLHVNEDTQES